MKKFVYIVSLVEEIPYESDFYTPKYVTDCPEKAFAWIDENPIPELAEGEYSHFDDTYYDVMVEQETPEHTLKYFKELLT